MKYILDYTFFYKFYFLKKDMGKSCFSNSPEDKGDYSYLYGEWGKLEKRRIEKESRKKRELNERLNRLEILVSEKLFYIEEKLAEKYPQELESCWRGIYSSFEDIKNTYRRNRVKALGMVNFCLEEWLVFNRKRRKKLNQKFVEEICGIYREIYKHIYRKVEFGEK